jgi:hypothetical protein
LDSFFCTFAEIHKVFFSGPFAVNHAGSAPLLEARPAKAGFYPNNIEEPS